MKKVVSLLVALATAFGVSATVFAAQDDILYPGAHTTPYASGDITGYNAGTGITGRAGTDTGAGTGITGGAGTGMGAGTGITGRAGYNTTTGAGATGTTGFNAANDYGTGTGTGITGRSGTTDYGADTGVSVINDSGVLVVNDAIDNSGTGTEFPTNASMRSIDPSYGTSLDNYAENQIIIVEDVANSARILANESHLEPGRDFKFRLNVVTGTVGVNREMIPITEKMLASGKFRLRGKGTTSGIEKAEIKKRGSGDNTYYRLEITTRETWGTKLNDVDYTISVTGQNSALDTYHNLIESTTTLQIGYAEIPDSEIDDYEEDDTLTISQDTPVITKDQFSDLAKNANYKAIIFEDDNNAWAFTGRVSGMASSNFRYIRDVIPGIVTNFEEQEFEFLTFGGGITFPTNGEMRIDVSDFSTDFGRIYTYLYRDGRLTPITTTYDAGADELVFRTNYLGSFIMTDKQITDTNILEDNNNNGITEPAEELPINPDNPGTGASRGLNLAMALGLASLAAIGITRKK